MPVILPPRIILTALLCAAIWGIGFVGGRMAALEIPPIWAQSLRFGLTAALACPFLPLPRRHWRSVFELAMILNLGHVVVLFTALRYTDAATAAVIVQTHVPLAALLGIVVLKEHSTPFLWGGLLLAFAGVILIAGMPEGSGGVFVLLMLQLSALAFAVATLYMRRIPPIDGMTMTAWASLFAILPTALISLLLEKNQIPAMLSASPKAWGGIVYMSIFSLLLAYKLWLPLVKNWPVSRIAPFLLTVPLFSLLAGWMFLRETPRPVVWLGGGLILLGVAMIQLRGKALKTA